MKPILIIWVPVQLQWGFQRGGSRASLREMMDTIQTYAESKVADNHLVLTLPKTEGRSFETQLFNADKLKEVDLDALRAQIKKWATNLDDISKMKADTAAAIQEVNELREKINGAKTA